MRKEIEIRLPKYYIPGDRVLYKIHDSILDMNEKELRYALCRTIHTVYQLNKDLDKAYEKLNSKWHNYYFDQNDVPKEESVNVLALLENSKGKKIFEVVEFCGDEWKVNYEWNVLMWQYIDELCEVIENDEFRKSN